jgi:hypothetical protein
MLAGELKRAIARARVADEELVLDALAAERREDASEELATVADGNRHTDLCA